MAEQKKKVNMKRSSGKSEKSTSRELQAATAPPETSAPVPPQGAPQEAKAPKSEVLANAKNRLESTKEKIKSDAQAKMELQQKDLEFMRNLEAQGDTQSRESVTLPSGSTIPFQGKRWRSRQKDKAADIAVQQKLLDDPTSGLSESDLQEQKTLERLGEGLGRFEGSEAVTSAREGLQREAGEGISDAEIEAKRAGLFRDISGSEGSAQRQLLARLGAAGVKGAAAGAQLTGLAGQFQEQRGDIESKLFTADEAAKEEFRDQLRKFDIAVTQADFGQSEKEIELLTSSSLTGAQIDLAREGFEAQRKLIADIGSPESKQGIVGNLLDEIGL